MFDQALLDSSPLRVSVLKKSHLAFSLFAGVLGSVAAFLALPILLAQPEARVLVAQCALVGMIFALSALMLCYVGADARHWGFNGWLWMGLTLVFNLVGFLAYLLYSAARTGEWRRATVPAAYCFEVLLVGGLVLMPLIYTEALPKIMTAFVLPLPPPPPGPSPATPPAVKTLHHATSIDLLRAPIRIPPTIAQINEEPAPPSQDFPPALGPGVPGGVPNGFPNGVLNSIGAGLTEPPPPPRPQGPKIIRVRPGGQVEPPKVIFQPKPEYPQPARMARIQGAVRLEAVISREGTVEALKVVSGHPLLVNVAFDAVSRWRYQPTLLNGEPVEVVMEFDVNFNLNE